MNSLSENELEKDVKRVILEDITPIIADHGGIINIKSIKNGVVTVTLSGKCSGCPSAQITTEEIIKKKLIEKLGKRIVDVSLYSEVSDELWNFVKKILNHEKVIG